MNDSEIRIIQFPVTLLSRDAKQSMSTGEMISTGPIVISIEMGNDTVVNCLPMFTNKDKIVEFIRATEYNPVASQITGLHFNQSENLLDALSKLDHHLITHVVLDPVGDKLLEPLPIDEIIASLKTASRSAVPD